MRRKRTFTAKMFGLLAVGALAYATSCTKDLEERIDALEDQMSTLVTDVDALQSELTSISSSFNSDLLTQINNSFTTLTELQASVDASADDVAAAKAELDAYKLEMADYVGINGITTNADGNLVITYTEDGVSKDIVYSAPAGEAGTQVSVEESTYGYTLTVGEETYTLPKAFENNVTGITCFSTEFVQTISLIRGAEVKGYFTMNTTDGSAPNGNLDITDFSVYTDAVTKAAPELNTLVTVTSVSYNEANGCLEVGFTQNAESTAESFGTALEAKAAYLQYKTVDMKSEAFVFGQINPASLSGAAWNMIGYNTLEEVYNDDYTTAEYTASADYPYNGVEVFVNHASDYKQLGEVNSGLFEVLPDSEALTVNIQLTATAGYTGGVDALADYTVEAYLIGCEEGQPDLEHAAMETAKIFNEVKGGISETVVITDPIYTAANAAKFDAAIAGNLAQDAVTNVGTKHLFADVSDMVSVKPSTKIDGELELTIDPNAVGVTGQQYFYIVVKATTKGGSEPAATAGKYDEVDVEYVRLSHVIGFDAVGALETVYAPSCSAPSFDPNYCWDTPESGSGSSQYDYYLHEKIYSDETVATNVTNMYGSSVVDIRNFTVTYLQKNGTLVDAESITTITDDTENPVQFNSAELDSNGNPLHTEGFTVGMTIDEQKYVRFTIEVPANTPDGDYTGYVTLKNTTNGVTTGYKYELTASIARPAAATIVDLDKSLELYGYSVDGTAITFDSYAYHKQAVEVGFIEQALDAAGDGSDGLYRDKVANHEMFAKLANVFMYDTENDGWEPSGDIKDVYEDSVGELDDPGTNANYEMNVKVSVVLSSANSSNKVVVLPYGSTQLSNFVPGTTDVTIAANTDKFDDYDALFDSTATSNAGDEDFKTVDVITPTSTVNSWEEIKYNTPYNVSLVYAYNDGTFKKVDTDYTMTYKAQDVFQSFITEAGETSVDDLGWTLDFSNTIDENKIDISYASNKTKPFYFSDVPAGTASAPTMLWFDEKKDQVNPWENTLTCIKYSVDGVSFAAEHRDDNLEEIEVYKPVNVAGMDATASYEFQWVAASAADLEVGGILYGATQSPSTITFVDMRYGNVFANERNLQKDLHYITRTSVLDTPDTSACTVGSDGTYDLTKISDTCYRIKSNGSVQQDVTVKVSDIWGRVTEKTVKVTIKGRVNN
ncbi:MAG: hypothetical protein R3Y50_01075 [Rikenellaceae bacterium]